jgi:hypothetical protein
VGLTTQRLAWVHGFHAGLRAPRRRLRPGAP